MPSDPAYIRNFKRFAQGYPTAADLPQLEAELYGSSDRASAVMLASITETALEVFLRSKVRPSFNAGDMRLPFDFSSILGSFGDPRIRGVGLEFFDRPIDDFKQFGLPG